MLKTVLPLRELGALILLAFAIAEPLAATATERVVPKSAEEVHLSFAPVAARASPAVVNVYSTRSVMVRTSPFGDDPFFRRFFGDEMGEQRREQNSLGSGVIVDAAGLVITNNHVIADGTEVKVALADRREFEADVLLKDEQLDLAVLRLKNPPADLPVIDIGDSDQLAVGDLVLAIGNPFGVGQTVTQGIVSALARSGVGISDYQFFIQTDAAINPGNSGGALVDMSGRLVGINTAIFSRGGGSNGIGFAIPSNMVRVVIESAERGGKVALLPWLGADLQPVTAEIAETLGLDRPIGVLVVDVAPESPAADAGLEVGDLITEVDGVEVSDPRSFNYRLATRGLGNRSSLEVLRSGETQTVEVELVPPPETVPREERLLGGPSPFEGAHVANLSPAVAAELGMNHGRTSGVVITAIEPGSPAERLGFAVRDVVTEVNGYEIGRTGDLETLASDAPRLWRVAVERDGRLLRMAFR